MLMYCKNSSARLGNSCVKTLIYVVRTVVHCSISVTFVVGWVALLTLTTEFSSVNTTGTSSVVWNKVFGKSLDSSKNSPDWICFAYAAGTSWNNCPYGNYCRLEKLVEICAASHWWRESSPGGCLPQVQQILEDLPGPLDQACLS